MQGQNLKLLWHICKPVTAHSVASSSLVVAYLQASNSTCSSNLQEVAQELHASFAAPILDQESSGPAAASKYQVTTYNVSQDTFLYDHVKVSDRSAFISALRKKELRVSLFAERLCFGVKIGVICP